MHIARPRPPLCDEKWCAVYNDTPLHARAGQPHRRQRCDAVPQDSALGRELLLDIGRGDSWFKFRF